MTTNNQPAINHYTTNQLRKCDFGFQEPATLILEDGSLLKLEKILRLLPGKRLVAIADYKNERVIAKIFFGKKNARVHADREREGAANLSKMKIPAATLKTSLVNQEKTTYILLFDYLRDADNLNTLWEETQSHDILYPILLQVTQEIATQHVLGVVQHDIHFKNFMITPHKVFTLDGGQLQLFPHKLNKAESMQHFAMFLSQMGCGHDALQKDLFLFYIKLRGWSIKDHDLPDLFFYIREANRFRWMRFKKKIFRNSSQFVAIQRNQFSGMTDRESINRNLKELLKSPDLFFETYPHIMLKAGRSSTVIKVVVQDQTWVIKRYNVKHFFNRLKRLFTDSRAKKSWYHAQKLYLFGINIPKPIAFIERKVAGFPAESYYVSEYANGTPLTSLVNDSNNKINDSLTKNIVSLFKKLVQLELTHGDLKATNVIIQNDKPFLIDYDGSKEHATLSSLRRSTKKDWRRFLKNFKPNSDWFNAFCNQMIRNRL